MMNKNLCILMISYLMTACASHHPASPVTANQESQLTTGTENKDPETSNDEKPVDTISGSGTTEEKPELPPMPEIEPETLYDLIVAELGGKYNRLDIALGNYMKQAHHTRDLNIIKRYASIASYMQAHQATLDAASLWLKESPKDPQAHNLILMQKLRTRSFQGLDHHFRAVMIQSPESLEFEYILLQSRNFKPEHRAELNKILNDMSQEFPEEPALLFLIAGIHERNNDYEIALDHLATALDLDPLFLPAVLLKVDILDKTEERKAALALLKKAVKNHPEHKKLRVIYARSLIRYQKLPAAQKEFQELVKLYPKDADLLMTLAILSIENKHFSDAKQYLSRLIRMSKKTNEAYLYLAEISRHEGALEEAIQYYEKIRRAPQFTAAQIKIAELRTELGQIDLARQGLENARLEDTPHAIDYFIAESEVISASKGPASALSFLTDKISQHPQNPSLLYARSMIADQLDRIDILEADLREILSNDPKNATALNALGYTLANRDLKLDEALELVQAANEIQPEDPAIMDSLGWAYFKLNRFEEAKQWLAKAYEKIQDHEIATHYGEVLWVTDDKEAAKKVWKKALKAHPDSQPLQAVMKKYLGK